MIFLINNIYTAIKHRNENGNGVKLKLDFDTRKNMHAFAYISRCEWNEIQN